MSNETQVIKLDERDLQSEDWENALHKLYWAKGQVNTFYKIRDEALKCMKRRVTWELKQAGKK